MSRDNLVFMLSGVFFGVLVGWIIGSERMAPAAAEYAAKLARPDAAPFSKSRAKGSV